jgi:hypothetical protein
VDLVTILIRIEAFSWIAFAFEYLSFRYPEQGLGFVTLAVRLLSSQYVRRQNEWWTEWKELEKWVVKEIDLIRGEVDNVLNESLEINIATVDSMELVVRLKDQGLDKIRRGLGSRLS